MIFLPLHHSHSAGYSQALECGSAFGPKRTRRSSVAIGEPVATAHAGPDPGRLDDHGPVPMSRIGHGQSGGYRYDRGTALRATL